ncbi:MAG TPA: hypothetical protein VMH77_02625 [Steroidobacteraceae bacterium]|nr:hypothetical protein [Steroidobacteraceae bacterium]
MNCQDISRISDTGSFSSLSDAERRAAEAHARSCRHCAPMWAAHAQLAVWRIPPMPAELETQCRTLAALPVHARGRPALRRLVLIGGVVALAAAAGVLALHEGDKRMPDHLRAPQPVLATAPASGPASPQTHEAAITPVSKPAAVPKAPAEAESPLSAPLPLLPVPVYDREPQQNKLNKLVDLALEKAADQHPELVEGPDTDGTFAVGATIREDGTLLGSAVKLATRRDSRDVMAEIEQTVPNDGVIRTGRAHPKLVPLPNGRKLRANVDSLSVAITANDYDITRSDARVLQILGDKYADLMQPAGGSEMNRLTVLLSDDGHIQREETDHFDPQSQNGRTLMRGDPNDVAFLARTIADRLQIDVSQIGLMGLANLEQGSRVLLLDDNGQLHPDDRRRMLVVYYAWQRRAGETGPTFGQKGPSNTISMAPAFDNAAALQIIERLIPDAFTPGDPAAGEPTVVLTAKGELIRAGRVDYRKGGAADTILQEQLVPGVRTNSFMTTRLTNSRGETADVQFAWAMPPEMAKTMDEAIAKAKAAHVAQEPASGAE